MQFPAKNQIMEGASVILQCIGDSNMPLTYHWYKDGAKINNGLTAMNNDTYSLGKTHRTDSGRYTCQTVSRLTNETSPPKSVKIACKA